MTLEESIKHCEDVADYDCFTDEQRKCSEEHRQLADWLRDYKRLLDEPEIIRCKDCVHYSSHKDDYMCGINVLAYIHENDYCSRAERRIR